jgi:hypothetical protein
VLNSPFSRSLRSFLPQTCPLLDFLRFLIGLYGGTIETAHRLFTSSLFFLKKKVWWSERGGRLPAEAGIGAEVGSSRRCSLGDEVEAVGMAAQSSHPLPQSPRAIAGTPSPLYSSISSIAPRVGKPSRFHKEQRGRGRPATGGGG